MAIVVIKLGQMTIIQKIGINNDPSPPRPGGNLVGVEDHLNRLCPDSDDWMKMTSNSIGFKDEPEQC